MARGSRSCVGGSEKVTCQLPSTFPWICSRHSSNLPKDYSNFPQSYIKKQKQVIEWKTPKGPQYQRKVIKNKHYVYTIHRPWEEGAKRANYRGAVKPQEWLEPFKYWHYFRGDRVEVLVGKDKGKQGVINYLVPERNWIMAEGLNCEYNYQGKQGDSPGILVKSEVPLVVEQEVSLVDPSDHKPTKIQWRFTEEGERVRVSVRTGRVIPIPVSAHETYDYKTRSSYPEQPKDTKAEDLEKITYMPSVSTFEMDIMKEQGIEDNRIPFKSYWY